MDGENEDRMELPGSHTANINPERKKTTRADVAPRVSRHLIQSTSTYAFFFPFPPPKRVNDDCGASLSSRSYRHPEIPDTMKSY